ncbi:MAG: hypothetical protein L6Q66_07650 [Bacteroidia bacterium]|nr:hypothetical protein [Bacteroidia bacterium]
MFLLLTTIAGILAGVAIYNYYHKKAQQKKSLYPLQKKLVLELIHDLKSSKIDVILSSKNREDSSVQLTLFEAKNFIDNRRELAREKYDDLPLLFTNNYSQILDFRKYMGNKYLPVDILDELRNFYNTKYSMIHPDEPYFIVLTDSSSENKSTANMQEGLHCGNGEAFDSWITFKESAANLNFVIAQWIRENADSTDGVLFEQLHYMEN